MPLNETQTCKQIIEPALTTAGWQFDGQVRLGPGRVRITGPSMYDPHQEIILDYLLRWNGVPLVAFEAKAENEPAFSVEICGGPHVENTRELAEGGKKFKIQKEQSSSAGVRRIKAVLQ